MKMLFPAALSVHGEVIRNLFPDWHSVLRGSRNSDVPSRIDQRFQKITADYAISVDTQQPLQSTHPQWNPNLFKRYNQPQTMMNRTQLSRNRRSEPTRHVAPNERLQQHPILAVRKRPLTHKIVIETARIPDAGPPSYVKSVPGNISKTSDRKHGD
ncbi:hypothetical protein DPMN_186353 [Dreissena polymorpha]|uniref:Uncharacterized protein n=1 Tax=Dreissena polymorpha TaxID=45954 RepID=A0A9D4DMI1_DREPO|nr:hypothetical protein DPMN_186353 [Dreissena polymorpha]